MALLNVDGLSKAFPGLLALDAVSLELAAGEVLALIGENGAGKSTLVKILTGIYQPDAGSIAMEGERVAFASPRAGRDSGVSVIHQETMMFDDLSVAENIFAGVLPMKTRPPRVDWGQIRQRAKSLLQSLESSLDPLATLGELSVAQKHVVAIAKALAADARIVIMDEPTASLSQQEISELFRIIRQLKAAGKGIIFISHKFEEIFEIADHYVVLRDGRVIGDGRIASVTRDGLISMMVGRPVDSVFPKVNVQPGEVVMKARGLSRGEEFADVSFDLRKGEILGFYGLVGAGRTEVMQALFGVTGLDGGSIEIKGRPVKIKSPSDAIRHGIAMVPEDRQQHGAILPMSISENVTLPTLWRILSGLVLNPPRELAVTQEHCDRFAVKAGRWGQELAELSGGNQQKVVLAKWLATEPAILILDEPTKGIDISAKAAVHRFMSDLVQRGLAIILVSSELPEILGMADRIVVMHKGRVSQQVDREDSTAESLVLAASTPPTHKNTFGERSHAAA